MQSASRLQWMGPWTELACYTHYSNARSGLLLNDDDDWEGGGEGDGGEGGGEEEEGGGQREKLLTSKPQNQAFNSLKSNKNISTTVHDMTKLFAPFCSAQIGESNDINCLVFEHIAKIAKFG